MSTNCAIRLAFALSNHLSGQYARLQGNLEQAALLYWLEHDLFDQIAANGTKVLTMRMPSVVQMAMPLSVSYFFGVPRSASYRSVSGDAQRVLTAASGRDENARRQHLLMSGLQGSAIEGSVLDQLYGRPEETSVSTTQYLAIAMRQGLKLFSITGENLAAVLPQLAVSQGVRDDIVNAVGAGFVAFVPERDIAHKGRIGIGYMLFDPRTGAAAYLIDGGRNGLEMPFCEGSVGAPGGQISPQSLFSADSLSQAFVGFVGTGATLAEQAAVRDAREAIARVARASAQRIAARLGPRLVAAAILAPVAGAIAVATAVYLAVEVVMAAIEIKLILTELKIQVEDRTSTDKRCECEKNPSAVECQCQKFGEPRKPAPSSLPPREWTAYDRRVDWHHRCADNSGTSYAGQDVRIFGRSGDNISVDSFDHGTNRACEIKTSFKNEAYVLDRWLGRIAPQMQRQKQIAESCNWRHCVIVNKPWMKAEIDNYAATTGLAFDVIVNPTCASTVPPSDDAPEVPRTPLDMD